MWFNLSSGLSKPLTVPTGTYNDIKEHVEGVTERLELKEGWLSNISTDVDDYVASQTVFEHNRWVGELYNDFVKWSETPPDGDTEVVTSEMAEKVWYGLRTLRIPYHRFHREVYQAEMDNVFEALQGKGEQYHGIHFPAQSLTPEQAAEVVRVFAFYLDNGDIRLSLPHGRDFLVSSDDYCWCSEHGAIYRDDIFEEKLDNGDNRHSCPIEGCDTVF